MNLQPLKHLYVLHNNPFVLEPVLPAFYSEIAEQDRNVLLAYLVLPLVLPLHTRQALKNLNRNSNLASFTSPRHERERFLGIGVRVAQMKMLTRDCLQHNLDIGHLTLGARLQLSRNPECIVESGHGCPNDVVVAATKLGKIVRGHTIPYVFMQFGIANL